MASRGEIPASCRLEVEGDAAVGGEAVEDGHRERGDVCGSLGLSLRTNLGAVRKVAAAGPLLSEGFSRCRPQPGYRSGCDQG